MLPNIKKKWHYNAKIVDFKQLNETTIEIQLLLPQAFNFQPAQYVWLAVHDAKNGHEIGRRAFSIASIPNSKNTLSIAFRQGVSAFKKALQSKKIGESITVIGPFGSNFELPQEKNAQSVVLLAGGMGVTPFLSLMRSANVGDSLWPAKLVYANSTAQRAAYIDELEAMGRTGSCEVQCITSRLNIENCWRNGALDPNALYYISGPQGFVDHANALLLSHGVTHEQLRFEALYPYNSVSDPLRALFKNGKFVDFNFAKDVLSVGQPELLKELIEKATSHLIVTDINGEIIFANQAAQHISGFSIDEMIGNTPRLWGGLMEKSFYKKLWVCKLSGESIHDEIINHNKAGKLYYAMAHISPVLDKNNTLVGWIGSEEDITDLELSRIEIGLQRAKLEEANSAMLQLIAQIQHDKLSLVENQQKLLASQTQLSEALKRLNLATQSAHIGVWEWDVDTNKLVWDDQMFRLYGIEKNDFSGAYEAWQKGLHPDDKKAGDEATALALQGKKDFDTTFRVVWPNGEIHYIKAYAVVEREGGGKPHTMIGVNWDVTREKEIDQAKTEFVSLASHQLRTPLTAIKLFGEMLLSGEAGTLKPKQQEYVHDMHDSTIRMVGLVNDLLNVSRLELGKLRIDPQLTQLEVLVENVLRDCKPLIRVSHCAVVVKKNKKALPLISLDAVLIREVIYNILTNALKYSANKKGAITIALAHSGNSMVAANLIAKAVGRTTAQLSPYLLLSIADNGIGVPVASQRHIFEKFYRADNALSVAAEGTGLGLYISKMITESSGGHLWFVSREGKGTTFYVALPLNNTVFNAGDKSLAQ